MHFLEVRVAHDEASANRIIALLLMELPEAARDRVREQLRLDCARGPNPNAPDKDNRDADARAAADRAESVLDALEAIAVDHAIS